jgi:hypothetical protein
MAVVATLSFFFPRSAPEAEPSQPKSPFTSTASPPPATVSRSDGGLVSPGNQTGCVVSQEPVSCETPGAALVADVLSCTASDVLNAWGLDPVLDALLIDVTAADPGCLVTPSSAAVAAGATADTLRRAAEAPPEAVLRQCARTDLRQMVSCASPHEAEFVGSSSPAAHAGDPAAACRERATKYSNGALDPAGARLSAVAVINRASVPNTFRCAIRSPRPLVGSVRDIGASPLPIASD